MNIYKLLGLLIGSCLIFGLHWNGIHNQGYYYFWYDIMMHFLGGAWIAMALHEIFFGSYRIGNIQNTFSSYIGVIIGGTIIVGVGWEFFEYFFDIATLVPSLYWQDTIKDMAMDTLGAIAIVLLFLPHQKN